MHKNLLWFIFFLWVSIFHVHSQPWEVKEDFQSNFSIITTKDGLSNNRILDIMQDKSGYIWIATENGLNRYDAYDFIVFQNSPTDSTTISSNIVTCIEEDIYGNLWVGTVFGLNKYDRKQNKFEQYFFDRTKNNSIKNNHIRALLADEDGSLWIETMGGYLHHLDIISEKIEWFKHAGVHQEYYYYHDIIKENDSTLWLGGRNMNVHKFNINTGEFKVFTPPQSIKTNDVSSYFIDSKDQLWVTGLDGAFILDQKSETFQKILKGSTFSIFEEENGSLWFGTGNGIFRSKPNSNALVHITSHENNPRSLSHNHVNKIIKDQSGVIWIATNNGLNLYSPRKNKFAHYTHIPGEENTISGNHITDLVTDKKDNLWIATASNGLNKMNLKTGEIEKFIQDKARENDIMSNHIKKLYFDVDDNLWIATWSGYGFQKLDTKTNKFSSYTIEKKNTHVDWHNGFLDDGKGRIQLAVWGGIGLYSIHKKSGKINADGQSTKVIPNGYRISTMDIDSDSLYWFGGHHSMINAYNVRTRKHIHIKNLSEKIKSYNDIQKMQNNGYVNAKIPSFDTIKQTLTFKDKSYFATESGLFSYNFKEQIFETDLPIDLQHENIYHLSFSENSLLVLCSEKIWRFDPVSQKWTQINLPKELNNKNIRDFAGDTSTLYIAQGLNLHLLNMEGKIISTEKFKTEISHIKLSTKNGLYLSIADQISIKSSTEELTIINLKENVVDFTIDDGNIYWISERDFFKTNIANQQTESLLGSLLPKVKLSELHFLSIKKKDGIAYIGTSKGLIRSHIKAKKASYLREEEHSFMGYPVHLLSCIEKGNNNDIWLGTTSTGLAKWNPIDNSVFNYRSNELDSSSFWGHDVHFIYKDSKENMWMGSNGLNLYHEEEDSFSHYTMSNGLADDKVLGMTEDIHGRLWIATKNGLSCFSKPEQNFSNYYESHGLPDNELTGAACQLKNGLLAFGTTSGFTIFHPDSLEVNNYIPPVLITEMRIQDNQIFRDLSSLDTIYIEPENNRISFHFAALDYNTPAENKYQFKLESLDEDWTQTDAKNRVINYSNLNHGTYVFKLKGSNNNDVWNENGQSLTIIILPHFYQQWWFYLALLFVGAFIIYMIILYRVRELKLQRKAAELEQRFLRSQMNPHFIFNSLGAIQSFIFKNEPLEAATYLSNFSELVRLILDNSRQDLIPLETELKTLSHYLDLQLLRFEEKFEYQLEVDDELKSEQLLIPPMLAQPFIENSIEHAFAGMKEKGLLKVCFRSVNNQIQLICEDNGMGIQASLKKKKGNHKKHQSLATKITRERIKVLNKIYPAKIELDIIDLKNILKEKSGTRVVFTIPSSSYKHKKT